MGEGSVGHSFLLAPNGKLRTPHVLWRGVDEVALVTGPGGAVIVATDLRRFKIRVDATIETEDRDVLTVIGPEAVGVLTRAGLVVSGDTWSSSDPLVGPVPFVHGGPDRFIAIGITRDDLVEAGATSVEADGFEALRIERGEPLVGRDVDDSTIPQEMGPVDHAVSFTKGCYLGQELVARIDSRGRVNRHLRGVVFPGDAPPVGATLVAGDVVVGEVTSVAASDALGAVVALATVRREVEPGDELDARWDGGHAAGGVRELPLG
jgi:folate-binding protein YgfZ